VTWRIEYLVSVVDEDIPALPKAARERIRLEIERKLATYPVEFGKPLQFSLKGCRRLQVGDYRVIFRIEPSCVLVVRIGHRKDVYER
jgi:mRNA interferase RelE/StbE